MESVKAASDVYVPVSGEVLETNQSVADEPGTVNKSPMDNGWFIKIKISDESEVSQNAFHMLHNQT